MKKVELFWFFPFYQNLIYTLQGLIANITVLGYNGHIW